MEMPPSTLSTPSTRPNLRDLAAVIAARPIDVRCVCGERFSRSGPGTGEIFLAWTLRHAACAYLWTLPCGEAK